jgi:hypothetical protein
MKAVGVLVAERLRVERDGVGPTGEIRMAEIDAAVDDEHRLPRPRRRQAERVDDGQPPLVGRRRRRARSRCGTAGRSEHERGNRDRQHTHERELGWRSQHLALGRTLPAADRMKPDP